jgi:hypothetical protein
MKKLIILIVIITVVGGLGYMGTQRQGRFEHHGFMEEIHHNENNFHHNINKENREHSLELNEFDTTEFLKVHSQNLDIKPFFTQFRTEDIVSFPCQNCHTAPLSQLANSNKENKKAHWDIEVNHASKSVMNCTTCHNSKNTNYLNSLSGELISFDKSFELCGQCHSTQYKDWQGGAHGKSISGWKPPRVVKTCVNCHNPHNPAIQSRWPSRLVKQDQSH